MINRAKEKLQLLEQELEQIEQEKSEDIINCYKKLLDTVRVFCREIVLIYNTCSSNYSPQEDILFFKELKPYFFSKIHFYNEMIRIENDTQALNSAKKKKYLKKELCKLKEHCNSNRHLYKYLRTKSHEFDHIYFVRISKEQYKYDAEGDSILCEDNHSSLYDMLTIRIKANQMLKFFLESELSILTNIPADKLSDIYGKAMPLQISNMKWTESKAAAVELLYGLYLSNAFNNGKTDLIEYIRYGEQIMGIPLKETFYKTYSEIKQRNDRTRFLQNLIDKLENKMDSDNEK